MFGKKNTGAAGHFVISRPGEKPIEGETRRCVHCGRHWAYRPGSGTRRGFCMKCKGLTCGAPECDPCVPYEARIEIQEGARPGSAARRYVEEYERALREGIAKAGTND